MLQSEYEQEVHAVHCNVNSQFLATTNLKRLNETTRRDCSQLLLLSVVLLYLSMGGIPRTLGSRA